MDATGNDTTIQTRNILFVTNSESGQANTILVMAVEATTRPHVEVHLAFPVPKRHVEGLSPKIDFHPLNGKAMVEMIQVDGLSEESLLHSPTTKSYEPYGRRSVAMLAGWDGECMSCFLPLRMWVVGAPASLF